MSTKRSRAAAPKAPATPRNVADPKIKGAAATLAQDSFANFAAGLGVGTHNLLSQGDYQFNWLTRNRMKLERMYRGSWVCGMVIDTIPEDMCSVGITIDSKDEPEQIAEFLEYLADMGVWKGFCSLLKWSRLYGGAIALIDIAGQDPSTPLDVETVGKDQFAGLKVYDRWQLVPDLHDIVQSGPNVGLPGSYRIVGDFLTGADMSNVVVHHSRVIRLVPIELPKWAALQEQLWGVSVLERMLDRIIAFDTTTFGAANLVQNAYIRVLAVDGFRDIMAGGDEAEAGLTRSVHYMAQIQSSKGFSVIDINDKFEGHSYNFSGLDDVMLSQGMQLSGASGVPLVKMFGQAPKGLNATGDCDLQLYDQRILREQESQLRPGLTIVIECAYRSKFGRAPSDSFAYTFTPLRAMTEEQKSTVATNKTTALTNAYQSGGMSLETYRRELKSLSKLTGLFTNISDEEIAEAELEEAPDPDADPDAETTPKGKAKAKAKDKKTASAADSLDSYDILRGALHG